jgi:hypothetical protein
MRTGAPSGDTDDDEEGLYGGGAGEGDAEDMVGGMNTLC